MSQSVNSQYNTVGTPVYNYPEYSNITTPQGQTVNVVPQNSSNSQIYQYPSASLYEPSKQASGVNIIINNPAGYTQGGASAMPYYPYYQTPQIINNIPQQAPPTVNNNFDAPQSPIANTSIAGEDNAKKAAGKTKRITDIDDNYIKTLESYLKSNEKEQRRQGITQLIKLCEEATDRYDNPALIALANIALQDPDRANRILAMTPLASGTLNGDDNTRQLLTKLASASPDEIGTTSVLRQQEAEIANEALLSIARKTQEVPDYSQPKEKEQ